MRDTRREVRPICAEWLLIASLVTLALLARLVPGERMVDDAYITFRYARNLVEGAGSSTIPVSVFWARPRRSTRC